MKSQLTKGLIFALSFGALLPCARAQAAESALRPAAEAQISPSPTPPPVDATPTAQEAESSLTFRGFFNLEFEDQTTATGLGDPNASFDVKALEILVNQTFDRFRLVAALDFEHGTDTELGRGHVTLGYGFVEYRFSDKLRLRGGKFLNPFGVYNEIHLARNLFLTVKEPLATLKPSSLSKNAFRYVPKWEAGLSAIGDLALSKGHIEYIAVLGNGESTETNSFEIDNNKQKSFTAKLQYFPVDELALGASFYKDRLSRLAKAATPTAPALPAATGSLRSFGAHARYTGSKWKLLAELASGRQTTPGATVESKETGVVTEVGYTIGRLTPYVQWYRLTTEVGTKKDSSHVWVGGAVLQVKGNFFLKLEDNEFVGSDTNTKFAPVTGHRYNEIKALAFYVF